MFFEQNRYHGLSSSATSNKDPCTCNQDVTGHTHVIYCGNYRSGKRRFVGLIHRGPELHRCTPAGRRSTRDCVVIVRKAAACIHRVSVAGGELRGLFPARGLPLMSGLSSCGATRGTESLYRNFCPPGWYQSGLGVEVSLVSKRFLSPFNLGRCTRETECRVSDGARRKTAICRTSLAQMVLLLGLGRSALQLLCDLEINFSNIILHFSARAGV